MKLYVLEGWTNDPEQVDQYQVEVVPCPECKALVLLEDKDDHLKTHKEE